MILILTGQTDKTNHETAEETVRAYIGNSVESLGYLEKISEKPNVALRKESILGMYLLVCGLMRLGIAGAVFSRTDAGAPIIKYTQKELFCSVSHKNGLVTVALSDSGRVGIDIEAPVDADKAKQLAERFYSHDELERLNVADNYMCEFLNIWTRKEALSKREGTGLDHRVADYDTSDKYADSLGAEYRRFEICGYTLNLICDKNTEIIMINI